MTIERRAGVALWRQIQQALEVDIASGAAAPGERLPTEMELAERFNVNRHTVRRAVADLEERGLVRVDQGRGMFVAENVVDYAVGRHTRFSENILHQSRLPGARIVARERLRATPAVAEALGLRPGTTVAMVRRVGDVDGRPVAMAEHFFSLRRFPDVLDVFREESSVSRALARMGVGDFARRTTRVIARMPDRIEADLLQQHRNRPILVTESVDVDGEGLAVEFGIARFAGDRVQLLVES
jgi:GntR family phosphonate transport system transcriptional regulator